MPKLEIYVRLDRTWVVGERSNCCEAHVVRRGGAFGSENAGLSSAQDE